MSEILSLSKQEKKILTILASGSLYKEIAADCNISINTVKKHLKNIYRKLNVKKRTQAIEKFHNLDLDHEPVNGVASTNMAVAV